MSNRQCCSCSQIKDLTEFKKSKHKPGGYDSICKVCFRIRDNTFYQRSRLSAKRRAGTAWYNITCRVGNKNGKSPAYADVELRCTRDEFLTWAIPEYENFMQKHPNKIPSINRKDSFGHYELSNLEVISFAENAAAPKRKITNCTREKQKSIIVNRVLISCQNLSIDPHEIINMLNTSIQTKKG